MPYTEVTTSRDFQSCGGGEMYFLGVSSVASRTHLVIGAYCSRKIFEEKKCFGYSKTDIMTRRLENQLSRHLGGNPSRNEAEYCMTEYESDNTYRIVIYMRMLSNSWDKRNGKSFVTLYTLFICNCN